MNNTELEKCKNDPVYFIEKYLGLELKQHQKLYIRTVNNMNMNSVLTKLFYSRLFRPIRVQYYHEAYQQGQFDKEMEITHNVHSNNRNPTPTQ